MGVSYCLLFPVFDFNFAVLIVNSNADNAKIFWRITSHTNGLLKVRCYFFFFSLASQFTKRLLLVVLVGKKNLEVRPTAINKVRLVRCWMELLNF